MTTATGRHQCPICLKCYKRREHLQRHNSLHSSDRPHRCTACNRAFQRADVLKRHLQTCGGEPNRLSRFPARRRACDRCVRQKKACNSGQPCQNCVKKAVGCCYSFASDMGATPTNPVPHQASERDKEVLGNGIGGLSTTDTLTPFGLEDRQLENLAVSTFNSISDPDLFDFSSPSWQDFLNLASDSQTLREPTVSDKEHGHSFSFLDNFTSQTGLARSFDCGSLHQRQQVLSTSLQFEASCGPISQQAVLANSPLLSGVPGGHLVPIPENMDPANILDRTPLTRPPWLNDPYLLTTHRILLLVKEVVTVKPRNSAVTLEWSPVLEQMCLQFFSPMNLRRFLELFWAIWHPNVNFVHRPTFDPASSKSILLAAMALIGACVSPDPADNENAKLWFNCVEEMVFIDDDFSGDSQYTVDPPALAPATNRRKIQALQASYMVCLYQNWEGTDANKRRIRRYRYSTVVSVARDVGITTARHANYSQQSKDEFNWNDFAAREELIRTFLWIFLLDTAFVIFNNLPPRMVIKEMKMHLACPEACFQAVTSDECLAQIQRWLPDASPFYKISFRSAFESVCKEHFTLDMRQGLADLGPLNLFAITSGLHCLIFQYQNSFGGGQLLVPIRNGLGNWKGIWQLYSNGLSATLPHDTVGGDSLRPENMWKRIGFMRHAPEFWLLASLMMDRIAALNAPRSGQNVVADLNGLTPLEDGPLDPIPSKYDQTSMRQVNDLIVDFQKVQIH